MIEHPNRLPIAGVLCYVDTPSARPPSGSRGRRVTLEREAAREALPTLLGMGLDCAADFRSHNARSKAGVITEAWIDGQAVRIAGFLFAQDFPEVARMVAGGALGLSYQLHNAHVRDLADEQLLRIHRCTFIGAAILDRDKAAYAGTSIRIAHGDLGIRPRAGGFALAAFSDGNPQ